MRRPRARSAAWTAGLVAAATVALLGIGYFMAQVHRGWWPGGVASDDVRPASSPPPLHPGAVRPGPRAGVPTAPGGASLPPAQAAEHLRRRALTIPVSGLRVGDLPPSSFAETRGARIHEALDIMAPAGTPVVAVEDGTVEKLFTSEAGGLTVYQFDPSKSVAYYYAHLQGYARGLVEGAPVTRGQVLGYVGSTGNANPDAPHLHFAIFVLGPEKRWSEGTAIDPSLVLR